MFIRESYKIAKNKKYIQYKLIYSYRTEKGPRQKTILTLKDFKLPKEYWRLLAETIENKLSGQTSIFKNKEEIYKKIDFLAEHYSKLILEEKLNNIKEENDIISKNQYETVDIKNMKIHNAKTIGNEHICLSEMKHLKIDSILKDVGFSKNDIKYAKMLIGSRIINPASERETVRWLNDNSGFSEFLGEDLKIYDNVLHRVSKKLLESKEYLEEKLSLKAKENHLLKERIFLYDLTNTYFESRKRKSRIAKYGKSKDGRNDCPLVTLALLVDEEGFPKESRILEGGVGEAATLEKILNKLSEKIFVPAYNKTIVIDAGIATQENLALITKKGFNYIAVSKKAHNIDMWNNAEEETLELKDGKTILKLKLAKENCEQFLLCNSSDKEKRDADILNSRTNNFEKELEQISKNLYKKGTVKRYDLILEKISKLKSQYRIGKLYKINIEHENNKVLKLDFSKTKHEKARKDFMGKYVLRTNRTDLSAQEISQIHRSLTTIESSFRSMKSDLGMRPNYHQQDKSMIGHIFVTVLGYYILSSILKKLRDKGINYSWQTIKNILSNHVRVTSIFNTQDNKKLVLRNSIEPNLIQRNIYKTLDLELDPLKIKKLKTSLTEICSVEI